MATPLLTPSRVHALLVDHGLRPSRALGQHFLADPNTARRIVRLAGVGPGDRVLEIGPGLGSLTLALADAGARVLALELDRQLAAVLEEIVARTPGVRVEVGDALEVDLDSLLEDESGGGPWHSVSNLPYNVAPPVVVRLLEEVPRVEHLLVMVQREVGERLASGPGASAYGALSVKVAYHGHAEVVGRVPPTVFVPEPSVESVLVRITRNAPSEVPAVPSPDRLFALVRAGFAQRRKMLRQSLRPVLGERVADVLTTAGVAPSTRAERLSLSEWAEVARAEAQR
jgi:16S rRNA (adenine1518-N6/adenine1519-N6)-dimethyltransferase